MARVIWISTQYVWIIWCDDRLNAPSWTGELEVCQVLNENHTHTHLSLHPKVDAIEFDIEFLFSSKQFLSGFSVFNWPFNKPQQGNKMPLFIYS